MGKRLGKTLSESLPNGDLAKIYSSYDIVGSIAIIRLTEASERYSQTIAEAVMRVHKNVKTVLAQVGPVEGGFRLRRLEYVAGENRAKSLHRESKCLFAVDLAKCYFSPRLSYERMRIAKLTAKDEVVVNMFAGVGCFSIITAKHSEAARVYSIDINPAAFQLMQENVRLNRVYGRVIPIFGDAKEVVERSLCRAADRVLMPLPEKAFEYLPTALLALKETGGYLHYYDFVYAKKTMDPLEEIKLKVAGRISSLNVIFEIPFSRIVRTTGPNWHQVVLDIHVKKFDKF
ncbi:MAG: class I SAM-dependent methyltransferase [Candidatus Bathycorpusculaceae bacterium]